MSKQDKYWGFDLDEHFADLWQELERVQDGKSGHRIAVRDNQWGSADIAALDLVERLVPFFTDRMYACDEHGDRLLGGDE